MNKSDFTSSSDTESECLLSQVASQSHSGWHNMNQYTIKKYNGDDQYSWAVFRKADVKGMRSPIFYGDAQPVMSGMDRNEARYQKTRLEAK